MIYQIMRLIWYYIPSFVNNTMLNYPFQFYGASPNVLQLPISKIKSYLVKRIRKLIVTNSNFLRTFAIIGCMITGFITICIILLIIFYAIGIYL
jgi:hypothetical protein